MAERATLIQRVRNELGDFGKSFRQAFVGDGETDRYDLPVSQVNQADFKVFTLDGSTTTNLAAPADFEMDYRNSVLVLTDPLPDGVTLIAEGTSYGLFSDADLGYYLDHALAQHAHGATTSIRFRDVNGFIRYATAPVTVDTLPELEEVLVVLLATIEALWTLSTDASTDIDVSTAEGTFVGRSQRYRQLMQQIDVLTEKYRLLSQQLNVGLFRVEISNLRRISKTTGRLVPIYVAREFDDHTSLPTRILPPIDRSHAENLYQSTHFTDVPVYDMAIYTGDDFAVEVDLPVDLTGCTVSAAIKNIVSPLRPNVPIANSVIPFTVTVIDATAGTIQLSLTHNQTAILSPYTTYDLQVTDPDGVVTTYLRGEIRADMQVTL